jgi:Spy/CpxP family protein refolding chaperone
MWNKRSELESLLDTPQPDADKVKAVQKELNALRAQMDEKRLDHELEGRKIAPDARYGMRYGRGTGSGGPRGFGPGACWR